MRALGGWDWYFEGGVKQMLEAIKRLFCKHEFEEKPVYGFIVKDGWLIPATKTVCKKCGKELRRRENDG